MAPIPRAQAERTLRRLLANGRLTALPKRPADQQTIAALAAARFTGGRTYTEAEVNEVLSGWLATVSDPYGIDHVTLRRMLVDLRLLVRTTTGSTYQLAAHDWLAALAGLAPAELLAEIDRSRSRRKRQHGGAGA